MKEPLKTPKLWFVSKWFPIALIIVATVAAYSNSLQGPFIFDDLGDIVDNRSIRHLWPLRDVFFISAASGKGLHNRPVVNLSWAINYAMGGVNTMPYHLTNLAIHILAAVTLFGIFHRTLALPGIPERLGRKALPLGLGAALIWALHPMQTHAVTYVTQRYESLMGLFYLASIYSLIRAGTSQQRRAWTGACVAAAMLAMGCKEVAVSAPICLLLYDRAFLAGSVSKAWARRRGLYLSLLCVWVGFALLQFLSVNRSSWAGYGKSYSVQEYALSQFGVILHYIRLALWPQPLVLDYTWPVARGAGKILPGAVVVGGGAAASVYSLVRWPKLGFLGAWFFLILAPTSSILPIADLAFLHRMYLSLAVIVLLAVLGVEAVVDSMERRGWLGTRGATTTAMSALIAVTMALAVATWQRNRDFQSDVSIWRDTVTKVPGNARALNNLGTAYMDLGKPEKAVGYLQEAIRLRPNDALVFNNLGVANRRLGDPDKAVGYLQEAIRLKPDYAEALNNLGAAYTDLGKPEMAVGYLQEAIRLRPDDALVFNNLGEANRRLGDPDKAVGYLQEAIRLKPDYAEALNNLGSAYIALGRPEKAIGYLQEAIRLRPDYAEALNNLGWAYAEFGKPQRAVGYLHEAIRLKPDLAIALYNLGSIYGTLGLLEETVEYLQRAINAKPDFASAHFELAITLRKLGRDAEATTIWRALREIDPALAQELRK